jgi:hypothetical protein
MSNFLERLMSGGQDRRAGLDAGIGNALQYYLGPTGIPERLNALGMFNPVQDIGQAMGDARDGDYTGATVNTLTALAPAIGGSVAMRSGANTADDVARWLNETLTGIGIQTQGATEAGRAFAADEFGGVGPSRGIRAYHGSPHDFDRFSMDKIGTGEGAQAYGHGLYFAENEGVARGYRDALAPKNANVQSTLNRADGDFDAAIAETKQRIANYEAMEPSNRRDSLLNINRLKLQELEAQKAGVAPNPGRMYEVNINADPDDFLDWDAPLSAQPRVAERLGMSVRSEDQINAEAIALMEQGNAKAGRAGGWMDDPQIAARIDELQDEINKISPNAKGESIYRSGGQGGAADLISQLGGGSPQFRTQELREAGIPGIKYRDAGSRGMDGDSGTRNFVVFDENLIEIVRKYGIAGAATILGVSASDVQAAINQQQPKEQ